MDEDSIDYYYEMPQEKVLEEDAPLWRRFIAFFIDLIVFNFLLYTPFIQVFQLTSGIRGGLLTMDYLLINPALMDMLLGVIAASTVIFCFYLALSEYVLGNTIGKQVMGLWVKGEPGLWGFVTRNLLKSTFILLLPFDLIGLITKRQRFIDQALGVKVLYEERIKLIEGFNT
ncbi:hypothetical protein GF352_04450 [archaeon]|nr:hypothetical protein [archaeon]